MTFPIDFVRSQFPALARAEGGRACAFLDAPGGTQVCLPAIRGMVAHLEAGTANSGGAFATSRETDDLSRQAHAAAADLLGARPEDVAFGPNMTTLTLAASRALSRGWNAGEEIVLTRLDHDANVAPWLAVAEDRGVTVRWLDFDPATGRLAVESLPELLGPQTRLVAVGGASNALGTLNDLPAIVALVRAHSEALVFVDAVQSAPHLAIDVGAIGCDLLACSPYKLFGPHAGLLWVRPEVSARLHPYKVRPAAAGPGAVGFETGTPSWEAQAGVLGMVEYLEALGDAVGARGNSRRGRIEAAMAASADYEHALAVRFLKGVAALPTVRLWGVPTPEGRVPTFALTVEGHRPQAIAQRMADEGIFVWSGHFYAVEVVRRLGLEESGGLLRIGFCHYNTLAEVDRVLAVLRAL